MKSPTELAIWLCANDGAWSHEFHKDGLCCADCEPIRKVIQTRVDEERERCAMAVENPPFWPCRSESKKLADFIRESK